MMGYPAVNGVVNSNQSIAPLTIPSGLTVPPKSSSQFNLTLSLNSSGGTAVSAASQQTGTGIAPATVLKTGSTLNFTDGTNTFTYTSAAGDTLNTVVTAINANANFTAAIPAILWSSPPRTDRRSPFPANTLTDAATGTRRKPSHPREPRRQAGTFSTPVTVYDALGGTHVLTATFTKTASNTWNYDLTIPAADVGQTGNPVTVKSGTLTFNGNGQLTSPTGSVAGHHQRSGGRRQQSVPDLESDRLERKSLCSPRFPVLPPPLRHKRTAIPAVRCKLFRSPATARSRGFSATAPRWLSGRSRWLLSPTRRAC